MDSLSSSSYAHLLSRTRIPEPSFQRHAVVFLFKNLRSDPSQLAVDSSPGRDALAQCLHSSSFSVADQSVRELLRLVLDSLLTSSSALLELHAALDGCADRRLASLFVKAIGFVSRFAFRSDPSWGLRFDPLELHPFVKVLSSPGEVQVELIRQVALFLVQNRSVRMEAVVGFLRPFLMFSILQKRSPGFVKDLVASVASVACSFPNEATCILKLLTDGLRYFPRNNEEEVGCLLSSAEYLVDAYVIVLKHMAHNGMSTANAQVCSMELLETLFSFCSDQHKPLGVIDVVLELSKRLLTAQKELGLHYLSDFVNAFVSISVILSQVEFEHEHLSCLKLLILLTEWKSENGSECYFSEELLCVFPVIILMISPSKSVKAAAADLLSRIDILPLALPVTCTREQISDARLPFISTPASIILKLLHCLWFEESSFTSSFFMEFFISNNVSVPERKWKEEKRWASQLRVYLSNFGRQKSPEGISFLLSSVASILLMHTRLGASAMESLGALSATDPKLGMPVFLIILFYSKILCNKGGSGPETLLRLLETLPSLATNSMMVPLIMQTILPMLHKEAKPVLYAIAVRLLCKIWVVTDRAFATLQGILDPKTFPELISGREISISIAASVRDVCKHNPDRGVDLILSVSSCIESRDSVVQALGLESLAHLCEEDVVDFYTAWNIILKHLLDYSVEPTVAYGLCTLLRWGTLDAEAYYEASKNIIEVLWGIATSKKHNSEYLWSKARAAAFNSLSHYKVMLVQECIPDFKRRNFEVFIYEDNPEVLIAMEDLEVEIIKFEHINRRRVIKEKQIMVHKIEKLFYVFPQVMFPTGKSNYVELPGAALVSLNFTPKDLIGEGMSKDLPRVHAAYEKALVEIAESLHTSRNIVLALLALQSWKCFIDRWMKAVVMLAEAKGPSNVLDESSKAANNIFKIMGKIAAESIPRVAVNIALAIGALCLVVPPSAHLVISAASDFLLKWLFEYEHEHKQWSAAISLGLVSNSFHATDKRQKFEVISAILKVSYSSESHLVRGACGVGLGYACQNLLTRVEIADEPNGEGTIRFDETTLVKNIVGTLSAMISQLCPPASDSFRILNDIFPPDRNGVSTSKETLENFDNLEEDVWGVAGLVLGLGNSVVALYRIGAYDAVINIKNILKSWIPDIHNSTWFNETINIPLYIGSCLVLPTVTAFCQRVELIDDELDILFARYISLVSELLNLKKSTTLHQNLLMASSIGAGSFLSCIMNGGIHSLRFDDVKHLLDSLRHIYTHSYPPSVHLGAMFGVVNALGAGAGDLTHMSPQPITLKTNYEQEPSFIRGPILTSPTCETISVSMIQEMFLVAKDSKDQQIQSFAAWAISILRNQWLPKEPGNVNVLQSSSVGFESSSQNIAEESLVWKLSLWLRDTDFNKRSDLPHASTVATALRCLSKAPRLPSMDWGVIIRRCMRYEAQFSVEPTIELIPKSLREESLYFSLTHASHISPLLHLLDDLTDLSRFRTLKLHLQSTLLQHLSYLLKLFSGSRLEKLYEDLIEYFSSLASSDLIYKLEQRSILRMSFWRGLHQSLIEASKESEDSSKLEKCMECLLRLLPIFVGDSGQAELEWSDAIKCLSVARHNWLMDVLQVSAAHLFHGGNSSAEAGKLMVVKARLVRIGCISASELEKLKTCILNARTEGIWWNVLVEVAAAVSTAEGSIKRQWLLDALEISCVAEYPSTALRFVGLLSGGCCIYMPLLVIDPTTVLSHLPVTLPSLLSDSMWSTVMNSLADKLWLSTNRICTWAKNLKYGDGFVSQDHIHGSEADMSLLLARIMHQACISLKDFLSFEKQLRLANFAVP
ncbi:protein RST1 isoform X2 [Typha latifolia]|uniref:protein RST1 isoform X2 n=1 Tax=Typha latifolia TaxID=4733 RepID=UPI003C30D1C2